MFGVTIFYALLAALCNALNVIAQHLGSITSAEKPKGWRFVVALLRNPMWLMGRGADLCLDQRVPGHVRVAGGTHYPDSSAWATGAWGSVGAATVLALLSMRGTVVRRTALLASAAAVMWALVAVLVKTMTDTLTEFGVGGMFAHWPVYALAGAGLGAEVLHQTTLHVGPLSVWIFQEYFTPDATRLAVGSAAFTAMCGSTVVLTRTAPPTISSHGGPQTSPASSITGPGR